MISTARDCQQREPAVPVPAPSTAEIIELAWANIQRRVAAELEAAKAMFPDIEEQARQANAERKRQPLIRVTFESRNVRLIGEWPNGQRIKCTAVVSCPVGSTPDQFEAQAVLTARAHFGEGYQWEATIL